DAHEHNIHDPDPGGDKHDQADHKSADADNVTDGSEGALEQVVSINFKVVRLVWLKAAGQPHRANAFVERTIISVGRERLRGDVYGPLGRSKILEKARDRHDANVV